ncbi:MAG: tetratricopeptide repeat protein, partial [Gammaproteobacteria bacterium]
MKLSIYALVFCCVFSGDFAAFSDSDFDKARRLQEMGRYPEAERLYRAVLAVDPDSVPAQTNLGVVLSRQGKHSAAIAAYQRVLRLGPALAEV